MAVNAALVPGRQSPDKSTPSTSARAQAAGENYAREGADEAYGPGSAGDFDAWPAGGDNKGVEKPNGDER